MRFEVGQVAIITGAASGIGRSLVTRLSARGLNIVAADVDRAVLESTVSELGGDGAKIVSQVVDVRSFEEVSELAETALDRFGRIDLAVNNAGVLGTRAYLWEQEEADWRWVHDVNIRGVMNGIRAFVPHFVQQQHGHIVNTSSIAGMGLAGAGHGNYSASKHAIVGLTEVLDFELDLVAPNVRATVLVPSRFTSRIKVGAGARPAEYRSETTTRTDVVSSKFDHIEGISADEAADEALAGIEAEMLYVPIGPGAVTLARGRAEKVLAEFSVFD